jgi:DNA-3-methyladenine glycosylase II
MDHFEIVPRGPFSLEAAANFGFGGSIGAPPFDGCMRLAFVVDGLREQCAVALRQRDDDVIEGDVIGGAGADAVSAQVARILSLDHDGEAWLAVGERDPVMGGLQRRYRGLRPVLFHSPYEAAAWSIVSARRPQQQAALVRRRLSEELGAAFDVTGVAMAAFPLPDALLELTTFEGLNGEKIERLRGVAEAALEGRLDPEHLRALPPAEAQAELQQIRGIGPFYAGLIHIRSSGVADVATTEPRALASAARVYGLAAPPDAETLAAIAEPWRPFRTWAMVMLRVDAQATGR